MIRWVFQQFSDLWPKKYTLPYFYFTQFGKQLLQMFKVVSFLSGAFTVFYIHPNFIQRGDKMILFCGTNGVFLTFSIFGNTWFPQTIFCLCSGSLLWKSHRHEKQQNFVNLPSKHNSTATTLKSYSKSAIHDVYISLPPAIEPYFCKFPSRSLHELKVLMVVCCHYAKALFWG